MKEAKNPNIHVDFAVIRGIVIFGIYVFAVAQKAHQSIAHHYK